LGPSWALGLDQQRTFQFYGDNEYIGSQKYGFGTHTYEHTDQFTVTDEPVPHDYHVYWVLPYPLGERFAYTHFWVEPYPE
jgi:hypothetical protein